MENQIENDILKEIEYFFIQKNSANYQKNKYYKAIFDITEQHIPKEDKKEIKHWLEYFLTINYSKPRFTYIEDFIDSEFIEAKVDFIEQDIFHDFIVKILNICAKLDIFENNLEFNENAFYLKVNDLNKKLYKIINNEIQ